MPGSDHRPPSPSLVASASVTILAVGGGAVAAVFAGVAGVSGHRRGHLVGRLLRVVVELARILLQVLVGLVALLLGRALVPVPFGLPTRNSPKNSETFPKF